MEESTYIPPPLPWRDCVCVCVCVCLCVCLSLSLSLCVECVSGQMRAALYAGGDDASMQAMSLAEEEFIVASQVCVCVFVCVCVWRGVWVL